MSTLTAAPADGDEPMSDERRRHLLSLCPLGQAALESDRDAPPPASTTHSLSDREIQLLSYTSTGRSRLEAMGVQPVAVPAYR